MTVPTSLAPPAVVTVRSLVDGFEEPVRQVFDDFPSARKFAEGNVGPGTFVGVRQLLDLRSRPNQEELPFHGRIASFDGDDFESPPPSGIYTAKRPETDTAQLDLTDRWAAAREGLGTNRVRSGPTPDDPVRLLSEEAVAGHWMVNPDGRHAHVICPAQSELLPEEFRKCRPCTLKSRLHYSFFLYGYFGRRRCAYGDRFSLIKVSSRLVSEISSRGLGPVNHNLTRAEQAKAGENTRAVVMFAQGEGMHRREYVEQARSHFKSTPRMRAAYARWLAVHDVTDNIMFTPNRGLDFVPTDLQSSRS